MLTRWFAGCLLLSGSIGCDEKPAPADPLARKPGASAAPARPAAAAPEPTAAQARWSGEGFSLSIRPKGTYAQGQPGAVEIVLEATDGYKCNDQYPYKFKASPSPGVTYASEVVTADRLELEKHRGVLTVPFTPDSAGPKTIAGRFAFSVCTDERCLVERRELALDVNVP